MLKTTCQERKGKTMNIFSVRIKALREERKLSQAAVGREIGVERYSIYSYENGRTYPDFIHLIALADLFEVSLDYLVGRSDDRQTSH